MSWSSPVRNRFVYEKMVLFWSFPYVCPEPACLGKMFVFIYKWLKKTEKQSGSLVVAVVPSLSG